MKSTDRMMIQDPAGLVQRIPELKPLCEDPAVLHAVERGDPFRLYRALLWARWMGRLRSHRELIDALLRQRRLFARPIQGSPWLGTINGFGATLLGTSEPDPHDGTYISTHCVVALFAIPLLPLGAYVVRHSANHELPRGWTLFARVPMGPLPWLWTRALALAVMALVVYGAANAFRASRYQDVRVLNGFEQPLSVELAGMKREVPARSMITLSFVPLGRQTGRAVSKEGMEVDTVELEVSSGLDVLAWNIAGAAPVFLQTVTYSPEMADAPPPSKPTLYCGRKVISLRGVDYAFREPPDSLQLSSSSSRTTRSYVGLAPQDASTTPVCLSLLSWEGRLEDAAPFLEVSARLAKWEQEPTNSAVRIAMMKEPAEALRIARTALQARPEDTELHRLYQWVAERTGLHEKLIAEYRARAEAQPDSATAQYLYARLLRGRESLATMEQLAQRFPQEPLIWRALIFNRWRSHDWPGTVKAWEHLRSLDASHAAEMAEAEATALVAQGRRGEALELLKKLFSEAAPSDRSEAALLYARVARAEKAVVPDELIAKLEAEDKQEDTKNWALRAQAGLSTEGAPDVAGLNLISTLSRDPQAALKQAAQVPSSHLRLLSEAAWALAYGEAVRTGAEAPQKTLERQYLLDSDSLEVFRRFVRGEAVSIEEAELLPEVHAAACFVRSRNAALSAEERQRLVEQARREDWLQGSVSEAIASWSP